MLREALKKAEEIEEHAEYIDFIPSKFTLQLHGWFDVPDDYKNLSEIQAHVKELFRKYAWDKKVDIVKQLKGKWHWDLRIKKETAPKKRLRPGLASRDLVIFGKELRRIKLWVL